MVANLLSHSNLFAAKAYSVSKKNVEVYYKVMHADKMKTPLLLF